MWDKTFKSLDDLGNREGYVHLNDPGNVKANGSPALVFLEVIISILSTTASQNYQEKVKLC